MIYHTNPITLTSVLVELLISYSFWHFCIYLQIRILCFPLRCYVCSITAPDSKVHGTSIGPHVGHMNLVIWERRWNKAHPATSLSLKQMGICGGMTMLVFGCWRDNKPSSWPELICFNKTLQNNNHSKFSQKPEIFSFKEIDCDRTKLFQSW